MGTRFRLVLISALVTVSCSKQDPGTSELSPTPTPTPIAALVETCAEVTPRIASQPFFVEAGIGDFAGHSLSVPAEIIMKNAGVAAGDFDDDCDVDLFVATGDMSPDVLYRNDGAGGFVDVTAGSGIVDDGISGGAVFADVNGDGHLDLFVGSFVGTPPHLYYGDGTGVFEEVTAPAVSADVYSSTFGDYDLDGDLDLFTAVWRVVGVPQYLWRNDEGAFVDVTDEAGLSFQGGDDTFTANFVPLNDDLYPDLLVAADYTHSYAALNGGGGTFDTINTDFPDENGMGAAVGDYDRDGHLDWFVTSIMDPDAVGSVVGNRLYRGLGGLDFEDVTDSTRVADGWWGWGACMVDFDNDTWLDIFHVNGYGLPGGQYERFMDDPTRLFMNNGLTGFNEVAVDYGIDDTGQGRGVVCFDANRDGAMDVFVTNWLGTPRLFLNQGQVGKFLNLRLRFPAPNTRAVGAVIRARIGGITQTRWIQAGSNFNSQNPQEAHFGLGNATAVDEVTIVWPDGSTTVLEDVPANQFLTVTHPDALP